MNIFLKYLSEYKIVLRNVTLRVGKLCFIRDSFFTVDVTSQGMIDLSYAVSKQELYA